MSQDYEANHPKPAEWDEVRSAQFRTPRNARSVQKASKHDPSITKVRYAKTDLRYWNGAIFQQKYFRAGEVHHVRTWAVKIQHASRRETFNLRTPNRAAAAGKAREIYLSLLSTGWDVTLQKFKRNARPSEKVPTTVGEFLEEISPLLTARPKTTESYCRAFRMIVANIFHIQAGREKYDYRHGGRQRWLARIHAVKLREITPDKIYRWKLDFIRRAGSDPVKQRVARTSVNSLMRQAKSLFAPRVLKFVRPEIAQTPFEGVPFESRQSMRYRNTFDLRRLISTAQKELPTEQLKIFLLAVMAGLRRNEIDKLEWSALRENKNVIRIEATHYFQPKTEDSSGDVEVDAELMRFFRLARARSKGEFVIESDVLPRVGATYSHYRCERHFVGLGNWLRAHGVADARPLHTLRKEYGSQICAKHGIYAASYALRHADIGITSQHYLDRRRRATVGLGNLLRVHKEWPATEPAKQVKPRRLVPHD